MNGAIVALTLTALAAGGSVPPQGSTSYFWYGQRVPVVRSAQYVAAEFQRAGLGDADAVVRRHGVAVAQRLLPGGRAILVLDVGGKDAAQRQALHKELAGLRGYVAELAPLASPDGTLREVVDRYVLARFPDSTSRAQVEAWGRKIGFAVAQRYAYAPAVYRLQVRDASASLDLAVALKERGLALHAEPDRFVKPNLYSITDTYYAQQWHLAPAAEHGINAAAAWAVSTGSPDTVVAVVDTGVDTSHPEFSGVGKLVNPLDVFDNDTDPNPPMTECGQSDSECLMASMMNAHGTACAGLVGAAANGEGVVGGCPDCAIMPVRLGPGNGMWGLGTLITAFDHVREHGAKVMSNSWGLGAIYLPQACLEAMEATVAAGVTVLFATGNGEGHMAPRDFASHPGVIAIGGSSIEDKHVSYSDMGPAIDLVAPTMELAEGFAGQLGCPRGGVGIVTTDMTGNGGMNTAADGAMALCGMLGGGTSCEVSTEYTCYFSGTSASTPIAAGAAGLLLSAKPSLTPTLVKWVFAHAADKIGDAPYDSKGWNEEMGYGRINLGAAVDLAVNGAVCTPSPEICSDGIDNDCDLFVDTEDPDCGFQFPPPVDSSGWGATCAPTAYGEDEAACGLTLGCMQVGQSSAIPGMGTSKGFCSLLCESECPEGFLCAAGTDPATGVSSGFCAQRCTGGADCPSGFKCATTSMVTEAQAGVCLPACQDAAQDCPGGIACASVGACGANTLVGENPVDQDAGPPAHDAGTPRADAGTPHADAGTAHADAGTPVGTDAGGGTSSSAGSSTSSSSSSGGGDDDDDGGGATPFGCVCTAGGSSAVGVVPMLLLGLWWTRRRR